MPATITATFKKPDGTALASAQIAFQRVRLTFTDPTSTNRVLATTNGSGAISVTLEQGDYEVFIPSTGDMLKASVPASSGTYNLSSILTVN